MDEIRNKIRGFRPAPGSIGKRLAPALCAALLLPAAVAAPAGAVFIKSELDVVDAEPLMDSEYLLDLLSFSPPLDWEWGWDWPRLGRGESRAGYRANGASTDATDLTMDQQARLRRRLLDISSPAAPGAPGPGLDFGYDLLHSGDKELEQLHQWVAIDAGPWRGFSAGVFGEPAPAKEDADIGALLGWTPRTELSLWASADAVDWNFNQRGRTTQRYGRRPFSYEAGADYRPGPDRFALNLAYDSPLERSDPALNQVYSYRRSRASLRWDRPSGWGSGRPGFRVSYSADHKREGRRVLPDPQWRSLDHLRQAHTLSAAALLPAGELELVEVGGLFTRRSGWSDAAGRPELSVRHLRWEAQAWARWRRRFAPRAIWESALFVGYGELRRYGQAAAGSLYASPVEAKYGFGVDFDFGGRGRIGLYGALDIDDADRHLWDGGNVRAQLLF